jgi:hypothetical protein
MDTVSFLFLFQEGATVMKEWARTAIFRIEFFYFIRFIFCEVRKRKGLWTASASAGAIYTCLLHRKANKCQRLPLHLLLHPGSGRGMCTSWSSWRRRWWWLWRRERRELRQPVALKRCGGWG